MSQPLGAGPDPRHGPDPTVGHDLPPGAVRRARLRALRLTLPLLVGVVVEVGAFVLVADFVGVPLAVLLVLGSTVLGFVVLARAGRRSWQAAMAATREGRPPADELLDGVLVFVGAVLMILPGLVNGLVGILLVLGRRLVRTPVRALLMRRARRYGVPTGSWPTTGPGRKPAGGGDVVQGEVVED
ncbi:MAG: FxsA family protein [Nocardioides alkalitolerans]